MVATMILDMTDSDEARVAKARGLLRERAEAGDTDDARKAACDLRTTEELIAKGDRKGLLAHAQGVLDDEEDRSRA